MQYPDKYLGAIVHVDPIYNGIEISGKYGRVVSFVEELGSFKVEARSKNGKMVEFTEITDDRVFISRKRLLIAELILTKHALMQDIEKYGEGCDIEFKGCDIEFKEAQIAEIDEWIDKLKNKN